MAAIRCDHTYEEIISLDNLLEAWREFARGKRSRADVQLFDRDLMENVIALHEDLAAMRYRHSPYEAFRIADPKPRDIHKAVVRDRLLHHALYRQLYPFFDRTFIADSFSCRIGKGTHKALDRFREFGRRTSHNHTRTVWILKCDVRKFFASIDQGILLGMLSEYIPDERVIWLLHRVIESFSSTQPGVGLPLGNLTSQLFVNVYMNAFDQFVKHRLGGRFYLRYADDFALFSTDKAWLEDRLGRIAAFLRARLRLELHPRKVTITTLASGVDFLGWVHFPDHRVLRTVTKRRMLKAVRNGCGEESLASYRGLLAHGNARKILLSSPFLRGSNTSMSGFPQGGNDNAASGGRFEAETV